MTKILIVGSQSFIGKNFLTYSKFRDVDEVSLIERRPEDIDFRGIDAVIHLAAIVHQFKKTPESEYYKINRDLCLKVAENAKKNGVKQFVFLSTFKVYGELIPPPVVLDENSPCQPIDAYGKSKYEAELGLKKLEDAGFVVSIVRTPLVYGVGVKANMRSLLNLVHKIPVLPFGKMTNNRCYTFVENLVAFIDRIIELNASGSFIAMDENPLSTTELVNYISKYFEKKVYLFKLPDVIIRFLAFFSPGTINSLYGSFESDNHKTLEKLNFRPPYSSQEGVKKMVLAFKRSKENKSDSSFSI
jgi:nucleoside-diphosphate-sugar epimerase